MKNIINEKACAFSEKESPDFMAFLIWSLTNSINKNGVGVAVGQFTNITRYVGGDGISRINSERVIANFKAAVWSALDTDARHFYTMPQGMVRMSGITLLKVAGLSLLLLCPADDYRTKFSVRNLA